MSFSARGLSFPPVLKLKKGETVRYFAPITLSLALACPLGSAQADKTDILGFSIGEPIQLVERRAQSQFKCNRGSPVDQSAITAFFCRTNPSNRFEWIEFHFTSNLEPNLVKKIIYEFVSGSVPDDQIKSIVDQYKPSRAALTGRGVIFELKDRVELEVVLTSRPAQPPGVWRMQLRSYLLPELDEDAAREKQRRENPPRKF
jgi:hypothetical protein